MRVLFRLFALLSLAAAVFHAIGLFHPLNGSPPWRHGLFIVVDFSCTYGFLRRPRWFVWFFSALALQQCYSHGQSLLREPAAGHASWLDLGVVLFMLLAVASLFIDARRSER
jgi:hypothetical protein